MKNIIEFTIRLFSNMSILILISIIIILIGKINIIELVDFGDICRYIILILIGGILLTVMEIIKE